MQTWWCPFVQEPAERIGLDAAMVHAWSLKGARPALQLAPGVVSALPLLTAVQVVCCL